MFVNTAAAFANFVFSENTSVRAGGGINFNDDDFVVRAEVSHRLIESLRLRAGVDVFTGPEMTYYGTWDENDRLFVFTTYFF